MELVNQAIGEEGALTVKLEGGKLLVAISHVHASGAVSVSAEEDAGYFFDKLAEAIPGVFDDVIIGLIKDAVKKL